MARMIDANEIEELFYKQVEYGATDLMDAFSDALQDAQTVDAVPVVRCKDCKHAGINENHPNKPLICYLTRMCGTVKTDWYCWQGERKENE